MVTMRLSGSTNISQGKVIESLQQPCTNPGRIRKLSVCTLRVARMLSVRLPSKYILAGRHRRSARSCSVRAHRTCSKSNTGYRPSAPVDRPDAPPKALPICAGVTPPDSTDCTARTAAAARSLAWPPFPDEKERRCFPGCGRAKQNGRLHGVDTSRCNVRHSYRYPCWSGTSHGWQHLCAAHPCENTLRNHV